MNKPALSLERRQEPPPDESFQKFKAAALLVGEAAEGAECWYDITIALENAFGHPLFHDSRTIFADRLATVLSDGIERALE